MLKFLFLFVFSLPVVTYAQLSDSTWASKKLHHQVGINATTFVKQFLSFNNSNAQPDLFSATYKLFASNAAGTRLIGGRVGVGYVEFSESDNPHPDFDRTSTESNLASKIGVEVQQKITNRWTWTFGLDFLYLEDKVTSKTESMNGGTKYTTTTKESFTNIGGGPFLGLQFNLNKRLSLGTEAAFFYLVGKDKSSTKTDFPTPNPQEDESSKSRIITFVSPAFINFNIMF